MGEQTLITVDGLAGTIEYSYSSYSYIARIRDAQHTALLMKVFGNGVIAEDWLLDILAYPAFVYLSMDSQNVTKIISV